MSNTGKNNISDSASKSTSFPIKKIWIFLGCGIILLSLFVTIFLNYYLEPVVKTLVSDSLKPYFGNNLTIGDIKLQLLKRSVQIKKIALKQPSGFGTGDLAEISAIDIKVQLIPLLQKDLIVDNLHLSKPHFNLIHKANKQSNLDYYINIFKRKALESEKSSDDKPLQLNFKKISIRQGSFSYTFPINSQATEIALKNIVLNLSNFNYPNRAKTKSSFKFSASTVTANPADISLSGSGVFCAGGLTFKVKNKLSNIVLSEYVYLLPDLKYEVKSGTAVVKGNTVCTNGYIVSDQETDIERLKLGSKSNFSLKGISANTFLKLLQDKKHLQIGFRIEGNAADLRFSLRESIIESVMKGIGRKFGIGRDKNDKTESKNDDTNKSSGEKLKNKMLKRFKR